MLFMTSEWQKQFKERRNLFKAYGLRRLVRAVILDSQLALKLLIAFALLGLSCPGFAQPSSANQQSVARQWNEVLLEGIRNDFARPTIHARNLFHVSAAMYDAWAVLSHQGAPYFLGETRGGYSVPFEGFASSNNEVGIEEAISYAAYRLIEFRYRHSPGYEHTLRQMNALMARLGYDPSIRTVNYTSGSPADLGNYIAQEVINFGLQDGANELNNYANQYYAPVNEPLNLSSSDAIQLNDPNRWQPLSFRESFVDQSGNVIQPGTIPFLGPEWGNCVPFALQEAQLTIHERDGQRYPVYLDPGPPPLLNSAENSTEAYRWGFSLVAAWSSQLDPNSGIILDISPRSLGNLDIDSYPNSYADYPAFYDFYTGKDPGQGHALNPVTNLPYAQQLVPLGDYARVLAEFWADGPDSETPPGHWYVLLNHVSDHPLFQRKIGGVGSELSALEWDLKAYFILGGAMQDAAIAAWSVKGYYDYLRPISAIRYLASLGQSSDPSLAGYSPRGLPLVSGYVELITPEDELLKGDNSEHLGKIKLRAWRGHSYVHDAATDSAGVGWIRAETWWPYQRPSFVTPPFAGYVSGHSTFSRAAAEVLTQLTGSAFFPGGIGEFVAHKDSFLVFEKGPSQDIVLQWATYYDAADQCSLSRIWGGIHAPADDTPGRIMGAKIGQQAYTHATDFFNNQVTSVAVPVLNPIQVYPNPTRGALYIDGLCDERPSLQLTNTLGQKLLLDIQHNQNGQVVLDIAHLPPGIYVLNTPSLRGAFARIVKQ